MPDEQRNVRNKRNNRHQIWPNEAKEKKIW